MSKETHIIQKRPKVYLKETYTTHRQGGPRTEYADSDVKRELYHSKKN